MQNSKVKNNFIEPAPFDFLILTSSPISKSSHLQISKSFNYASNSPAIKFKLLIVITASLSIPPWISSG